MAEQLKPINTAGAYSIFARFFHLDPKRHFVSFDPRCTRISTTPTDTARCYSELVELLGTQKHEAKLSGISVGYAWDGMV